MPPWDDHGGSTRIRAAQSGPWRTIWTTSPGERRSTTRPTDDPAGKHPIEGAGPSPPAPSRVASGSRSSAAAGSPSSASSKAATGLVVAQVVLDHPVEPGERVRGVVDTQVDGRVAPRPAAALGLHHQDRRRTRAPVVAAGVLPGVEGGHQPVGQPPPHPSARSRGRGPRSSTSWDEGTDPASTCGRRPSARGTAPTTAARFVAGAVDAVHQRFQDSSRRGVSSWRRGPTCPARSAAAPWSGTRTRGGRPSPRPG